MPRTDPERLQPIDPDALMWRQSAALRALGLDRDGPSAWEKDQTVGEAADQQDLDGETAEFGDALDQRYLRILA